jgi:hypothetical protein
MVEGRKTADGFVAVLNLKRSMRDASRVRREIARLFGATPHDRVVLAPGMLGALRHLFSALDIRSVIVTDEEYYAPRHFPSLTVTPTAVDTLVARVSARRPDAVIASVVSWRGHPLPVAALFGALRRQLGRRAPLLVADYTHAGAIGFPSAATLDADIVGGDPEKWLLPAKESSRLAFLWMRSPALFRRVQRTFAPFFLAIEGASDARSARWLRPQEIEDVAAWLADARLTRRAVRDRHRANLQMKARIVQALGISDDGPSSVIWTRRAVPESLESQLQRQGLIWRAERHTRILCRADSAPPDLAEP